ncbi:tRNA dimethylallyltransferase, mitochondrial, variant 4 [Entomophthora muscae]|nr:tRNA dimethylallyltransferase, mitochondrial, variant 4 [Entomophthora muscae]
MIPKPVIAIIGTTGVGKTKLSLELAARFKTEIINVDAMQMYKGFDILTNKATLEERKAAPHHLIDFVEVDSEYQVQDFEKDALFKIEGLHSQGKIPILVGGTHYYIQSLLWKASLINLKAEKYCKDEAESLLKKEKMEALLKQWEELSNKDLFEELEKVDPKMAEHWHVNDRRKVIRSLTVFHETGKPQSEWILERAKTPGEGKELRFNTIFLWLYANKAQLDTRLDTRVDRMVEQGLFEELKQFQNLSNCLPGGEGQYDRGLKQAIGFRAFDAYFCALRDELDPITVEKLKKEGLEVMKQQTRKYAKKQVGWIRNQLLPLYFNTPHFPSDTASSPTTSPLAKLYLLDATDLDAWSSQVQEKAVALVDEILKTRRGPDPTSLSSVAAEYLKPPSKLK